MTAEVVTTYLAHNAVAPAVPALIAIVHDILSGLGKPCAPIVEQVREPMPAVAVRKSITDDHLISRENGKPCNALKRHLFKLGMTPDSYREKWGMPGNYPMVSPALRRARSILAKEPGVGSMRWAR